MSLVEALPTTHDVVGAKRMSAANRYLSVTCGFDLDELTSALEAGPPKGWQRGAECLGAGGSQFFPERGGEVAAAKQICSRCEVRRSCLVFALTTRERHGVWGGMAENQRRRVRQALDDLGVDLPRTEPRRLSREGRSAPLSRPPKVSAARDDEGVGPVWKRLSSARLGTEKEHRTRCASNDELPHPTTIVPPMFSEAQRLTVRQAVALLGKSKSVQLVASRPDVDRVAAGTAAVLDVARVLLVVPGLQGIRNRLEHWRAVGSAETVVVVGNEDEELGGSAVYAPTAKRLLVAAAPGQVLIVAGVRELSVVSEAIATGMPEFDLIVVDDVGWMLKDRPGAVEGLAEVGFAPRKVFVHRVAAEVGEARFGALIGDSSPRGGLPGSKKPERAAGKDRG